MATCSIRIAGNRARGTLDSERYREREREREREGKNEGKKGKLLAVERERKKEREGGTRGEESTRDARIAASFPRLRSIQPA